MPCSSTCCPGRPPYVPFPPHGWSAPDGLPLLLCKQPIWAAGDTPHLMPVEQGLPWHPVATGLAGQAIPFVVAASHAHALPSPPFWFLVPNVLVAYPASLCPSSLSVVLALVPPGVAPAFCVSVLLLPPSVGAPGCPFRAPPPRISHLRTTWTVPRAVGWSRPCCHPCGGHLPARRAQLPPLWSTWAPHRGRGGGVFADGSLGVCRIWWLLQCSHLMVPLCLVVCPVGARLTAVCGAALCPVALLLAFLPILGSFFFCWHAHRCWCAVLGGQHVARYLPLWLSGCPPPPLLSTHTHTHPRPPPSSAHTHTLAPPPPPQHTHTHPRPPPSAHTHTPSPHPPSAHTPRQYCATAGA